MQTCYCTEPPPSLTVLIRRGLFAVAARTPLVSTRSDVSRLRETRSQNYTRMYSFDGRYAAYLQKGLDMRVTGGIILTAHSSQLTAHSSQLEYSLDSFLSNFHKHTYFFSSVNTNRFYPVKRPYYALSYSPLFSALYRNARQAIWFDSS